MATVVKYVKSTDAGSTYIGNIVQVSSGTLSDILIYSDTQFSKYISPSHLRTHEHNTFISKNAND